ncbi:ABC transporter permease [Ruminococcus albus]|uniref:Putative ABC transport system permease protein n=1 Tax=Ruminococcus albus TaxID=1264 RepID=A0A1H7KSR4_RUMAL|nr:ABC transporter permease [Ruminococcus albus]SEK89798.1 putative ABC transport system permease protein [Ruminococcus albus]
MFFRILKKDLKRKKTMNIILLLFIILCSMFAAASVNNIIAVTGGIDHYFDMANVPDISVTLSKKNDEFEKELNELPSIKEIKTEKYFEITSSKSFIHNGVRLTNFINPANLLADTDMALNYFDKDNNIIESVEKGTFYATIPFTDDTDIKGGDDITVRLDGKELTLKYMGYFKGALFSTEPSASPMLLVNPADYSTLKEYGASQSMLGDGKRLYINTSDTDAIEELAEQYDSVYASTREQHRSLYLYDMLTAYIMMAISIVLMITAFVVLRFTIGFTIAEEFREIGVMKAVGIQSGSIRGMYIIKYLAISVAGALIGFICSMPLQDMMMKTVSKNMVLGSENGSVMGAVSCVGVVTVILIFCYICTRRVKKLSPIDAVRNGQTGERFGRRSMIHLGSSKLPSTGFMALNDVMSAPKRFGLITLIFALCMLIVTLMSNFALTLKSEKILWAFTIPESEAHIMDAEMIGKLFGDDKDACNKLISDVSDTLEKEGIQGQVSVSVGKNCKSYYKDKTADLTYWVNKGENVSEPRIDEGCAPGKSDEIVLTGYAMDDLGAGIGDRIKADFDGEEKEFLVTGKFSTFMGSGHTALLYNDVEFASPNSASGIQIHFDGSPDKETINKNIDKLREVFDTDKIYNTSDMIKQMTGISDTLNTIKKMMMILTAIVTAMIVVLMERSFISKEKSEIALMKAVGVSSRSIIAQHTLRFVMVSVIACIVSLAALMPISNIIMDFVCSMIGDISGMKCDIDPIEIFVICPVMLILVTTIGAMLTALYTRTIRASDTASIE